VGFAVLSALGNAGLNLVRDWNALGSATGTQLLDQSGLPEIPGDLQR